MFTKEEIIELIPKEIKDRVEIKETPSTETKIITYTIFIDKKEEGYFKLAHNFSSINMGNSYFYVHDDKKISDYYKDRIIKQFRQYIDNNPVSEMTLEEILPQDYRCGKTATIKQYLKKKCVLGFVEGYRDGCVLIQTARDKKFIVWNCIRMDISTNSMGMKKMQEIRNFVPKVKEMSPEVLKEIEAKSLAEQLGR